MMTDTTHTERRKHNRLRFPDKERPEIILETGRWPVVEISESGLVFSSTDLRFMLRQPFRAVVRFRDESLAAIEGVIVRMKIDTVYAACLNKGFSTERIAAERQRLQARGKLTESS
ncbi:MAG: hypothetical protein ACYC7E_07325 [Armatimonadota bacterium]